MIIKTVEPIDRGFVHFVAGIKPAQKKAAPAPVAGLSAGQLTDAIQRTLGRAVIGPLQPAVVQFKGIGNLESREAMQLLLSMSAAERQKVMEQLTQIEGLARAWGMIAADLIDLLK